MKLPDGRWGQHNTSQAGLPCEVKSLAALQGEIMRARSKFPGNRHALSALVEEVGEMARALLQRKSREDIEAEAIQVACVAMRIYEEGDASFSNISDEESQP